MHRFLLVAAMVGTAALVAGSAQAQEQANDDALSAKSDVPGIEFVMLDRLPKAPSSAGSREACDWKVMKPQTAAGQAVAALGWGVTAEKPLGNYQAVSFAGEFQPATSGGCEIDKGNVAIFLDRQLIALAYAGKGSKQTIGSISALQDGLRIWDGSMLPAPVADIHFLDGYLFQVASVADEDQVCGGRGKVPNIYGKPIDKARQALGAAGWTPLKNPKDLASDEGLFIELALSRRGIVEVDTCSGTGFGFCQFYYRKDDMELSVVTAGEGDFPAVSGYDASCDQAHWHQPD